jgi:integral membrane protein (TIGR01906 family)
VRPANPSPASALITLAVPLVIFGNAGLLLLTPLTGDLFYALPGFPDDPLGLRGDDRERLAADGIRSIWPVGPGTEILRDARLPEGPPAFTEFEISHMDDVRSLVRAGLLLWLVALAGALAALTRLLRTGRGEEARRSLRHGALLTIAVLAVSGLAMLVAYEAVFDAFHGLFFADGTWSFADRYTLRRIYPDAFWSIASAVIVLLSLLQCAALLRFARRRERSTGASDGATP